MLEFYTKFDELRDIQAFPVWLKTIVYRKCINMTTYEKKDSLFYISDQSFDHLEEAKKGTTLDKMFLKDAVVTVKKALQKFEEPKKNNRHFVFLEGYSSKEISELMSLNVNTVYSHMHRIRKALEKQLDNENFSIQTCLSARCLPTLSNGEKKKTISKNGLYQVSIQKNGKEFVRIPLGSYLYLLKSNLALLANGDCIMFKCIYIYEIA